MIKINSVVWQTINWMVRFVLQFWGDQMIWKYKHRLRHCWTAALPPFSRATEHSDIYKTIRRSAVRARYTLPSDRILTPNTFLFDWSLEAKEYTYIYTWKIYLHNNEMLGHATIPRASTYIYIYIYVCVCVCVGGGRVAQSVKRLSYGLDGLGSNPGEDEIFRQSRPAMGPTQPPVHWVPGLSRG